jgi:hypothetical protein
LQGIRPLPVIEDSKCASSVRPADFLAGLPNGLSRGDARLAISESLPQLAAVTALQRAAGRDLFLVVATTETSLELRGVIDALAVDRVLVVCLSAPPEVVAGRIAVREPDAWPGKRPLIAHAWELAVSMPAIAGIDVVVDTDGRSAVEVAAQVRALLRDHDLIPGPDV